MTGRGQRVQEGAGSEKEGEKREADQEKQTEEDGEAEGRTEN